MDGSQLSRRQFAAGAGSLAAASLVPSSLAWAAPRRPTLRSGRFAEGVISGDPTPNGITLWTRLTGASGSGTVALEVAKDAGFRKVVKSTVVPTGAGVAHAVKAKVTGLNPYEQYYYRFATRGQNSPVGRFRTALPPDSRQPVTFAFFSCQDYTFGFYNAHERLAREDVDFVVNLGDYIYAEAYHTKGSKSGGVRTDPIGESETLDEYRRKYALYRSDPALRAMHAAFPMISIWDDHEVVDNYAGGAGPRGGLDPSKNYTVARRRAAYRAFFESMPTFPVSGASRIYRGLRFGRNVDLILIDERQYRGDQPCEDKFIGPACEGISGPQQFLGRGQMSFLKGRLASTPATWKVIANEVMIMNTLYPGGQYINFDAWQGYVRERDELLNHIKGRGIDNVVFVTGDIHTIIAGDVRLRGTDTQAIATEFVGGSITSQGLGEGGGGAIPGADPFNPNTPPALKKLLFDANPWVKDADTDHHGYGLVRATRTGLECRLKRMKGIKTRSGATLPDLRFNLKPGQPSLLG